MRRSASERNSRPEEVAAYVAEMAREMKAMVERHDLSALAYLLELVRLEAEERAERLPESLRESRIERG